MSTGPATRLAPWTFAAPWGARGYVTDLGSPVHWVEFRPSTASPPAVPDSAPIVFVHGLGGSHLNWCLIGPRLAEGRRAVALDLHGFGLTPGSRVTSTVQRNTGLLDRFVREITGTPVILAGNSMGGLISIMQASGAPETVAGLVLIDPAMPLPPQVPDRVVGSQFLLYALPGLGELYVRSVMSRRPPQQAVHRVIDLCFADPSRIDPALLTASIALAAERHGQGPGARDEAFLAASRSLMRVASLRRRYWEMMASVRVPVLLIGGAADRLVPVAAMRRAAARNPRWETVILPGVGHTPQLEAPDTVAGTMRDWLGRHFTPAPVRLRGLAEEERVMQQLSGLDASFLALETASTTGHVGGLSVLDPSTAPAPLTLARLTEIMTERLPLVPVLRRKLLNVPFGLDQPYWIDDADFDIEYHVRELALPRPGSDAQLTEQVSRLHARPLDRSRPLWEIYLITGLARKRAAVYTKIHHAAIDGASGAELLTILFDLAPAGRELPPPAPFRPAAPPPLPALAAKAAARLAWRPVQTVRITNDLVRVLPTLAPAVNTLVGGMLGLNRGDGTVIATRPGRAPATPFNRPITPHRRFAFRSVSLDTVKAVKNAFGVSVNDVVMAMCAGALRRWLIDHDALPDHPLIAMIPVSVRDPASKGALGNRVSAMLAPLPTSVADPGLRLQVVHSATKQAKAQQAAIPQGLVDQISDFAVPALTARAARVVFATGVLHRLPPFNVTISNVPGPNVPVYLGGARLIAHYPVSVVTDGQGLNITLVGYLGQLHFGLVSCRELVPDIDTLAGYLTDELAQLVAAAEKRAANAQA